VEASSFEREEKIILGLLIPLPTQRELHVVCAECNADFLSDLPLDELADLDAGDIEQHLFYRVSLIAKTFAVASLVLFLCPFVSLVLGAIAIVLTWKSRGWTFWTGVAGAALNVLLWGTLLTHSALVELKVL
jgi:hypothetical protein